MKNVRTTVLVTIGAVLLLILVLSTSSTKPAIADQVWSKATVTGETENPKHHFVLYTDLVCPYCDLLGQTLTQHQKEFQNFLAEHRVLFEVRVTNMLNGSGVEGSTESAEAAYCAARADKFWDFYHGAMKTMYDDFQSHGIGVSKTAPRMTGVDKDYWLAVGKTSKLGKDFANCIASRETAAEVYENTMKAAKTANGVPAIFYNGKAGNIDGSNGWEVTKKYLELGLEN